MKPINIIKLISAIVICQLAGFIGSFFTTPAIQTWYATIQKPSFNPPNWIFSPVWISLFVLMGIALFLVWKKGFKSKQVKIASSVFGTQLFLNILWSVLFFGLKSPFYAFIEICILWIAIMFTIMKFYKISKTSAYLLLPYLIWVSFAAVLNFAIFWINL